MKLLCHTTTIWIIPNVSEDCSEPSKNQENLAIIQNWNQAMISPTLSNRQMKKNKYTLEYNHTNRSHNKCNQCLIFVFKCQNYIYVQNI